MAVKPENESYTRAVLTAPAATAVAAVMTVVGGVAGALVTGYYSNRTSIELEQIKFETGLIVKAIDRDQASAAKTLQFLAEAGLVSHYEARILKLVAKANGLDIPSKDVSPPLVIAAPINSFSYLTSPHEEEAGRRDWRRVSLGHWTESYPGGKTSFFVERARINVNGCPGTVVANEQELNFQVFISDRGCAPMSLWFRRDQQDWIQLAPMINVT